jgi:hypothetical protein
MLRRTGSLFLALLIVLGGTLVLPAPARAVCTCTATTPEQGMRDSAIVFLGSLVEISPPTDELVTLSFDVRLVYKGELGLTTELVTFAAADQCGVGDTARRGEWLVFGYEIPGGDGQPLLSTCSPSAQIASNTVLPVELGEGRAPPGAESLTPAVVTTVLTYRGAVTDPQETATALTSAVALLIVVGVVARLLAGRRRLVVR